VTAGFIIQQRFIDQVRRETHKFQQLAIQVSMNREEDITALCKITIQLHPDQQNEVVQAFADAGVPCIP
jgi:hypothetical protein